MNKLSVELDNCYGIKCFKHEFDFSKKKACLIYAPNGTMKTSFAKTFREISCGNKPKEQLSGENGIFKILKDNEDILKDEILVIHSYEDKLFDNISKLLVNSNLRDEYVELVKGIEKQKECFLNKLKSHFGITKTLEIEFRNFFNKSLNTTNILENLDFDNETSIFNKNFTFKYTELFNLKTLNLMTKSDFIKSINDYVKLYDELLNKSLLFKKGEINHNNFDEILRTLEKQNFFKIKNKITLANGLDVLDLESFQKILSEEKNKILSDEKLQKKFEVIEKLLSNEETKKLREILEENREFLLELSNLDSFQKKIWKTFTSYYIQEFKELKEIYTVNKEKINKIIEIAESEKSKWEEVVELYNERFNMPFTIKISNKADSLLGIEQPQIQFEYKNNEVDEKILKNNILSTGEKRALYILNVLYNLELCKQEKKEKLIILDDIADSFDYKNKYAIIEYLNDLIDDISFFKLIILTHNFDFYRTIGSRLSISSNSFMAIKDDIKIELKKGQYFKNIFLHWKKNVWKNNKVTLATIPFVRNLIEYSYGMEEESYNKLTNLLHYKLSETEDMTILDLNTIYNKYWFINENIENQDELVTNILFDEADKILVETDEVALENKIVLSMAIRQKSEKYMLKKILEKNQEYKLPNDNQTRKLFNEYKKEYSEYTKEFEAVNLMTAENIHINSFMYEPLIDTSLNHLKKLYEKLKQIGE